MLSKRTLEQELGGFGHTKVQFLNSAGEERKKGSRMRGLGGEERRTRRWV